MSDFSVRYKRTGRAAEEIKLQSRQIRNLAQAIRSCDKALNDSVAGPELHRKLNALLDKTLQAAASEASMGAALAHITRLYEDTDKSIRTIGRVGIGAKVIASAAANNRPGTDKRSGTRKFIDWLFKRKVDPSKTATNARQEAAADKAMRTRIEGLRNTYRFSEEAWKKATVEQRKKILTDYMRAVEKILGVDVSDRINWTYTKPKNGMVNYGSYTHETRTVAINEYVLRQKNSYHLMTTITHELRHAYQHSAIDHPDRYRVTQETINSWKESFRTYNREQAKGYESYRNIVVEKDARWFAGQR